MSFEEAKNLVQTKTRQLLEQCGEKKASLVSHRISNWIAKNGELSENHGELMDAVNDIISPLLRKCLASESKAAAKKAAITRKRQNAAKTELLRKQIICGYEIKYVKPDPVDQEFGISCSDTVVEVAKIVNQEEANKLIAALAKSNPSDAPYFVCEPIRAFATANDALTQGTFNNNQPRGESS